MRMVTILIVVALSGTGIVVLGQSPTSEPSIPVRGTIRTHRIEITEVPESLATRPAGNLLRTLEVNREVATDEELVFDRTRNLWRFAATDARDLDDLQLRMSLTDEELKGALRTRTALGGLDGRLTIIWLSERGLAHLASSPQGYTDRTGIPFEMGFVDEADLMAAPGAIVEGAVSEGEACRRVIVQKRSETHVVVLHPKVNNRFQERTTMSPEGRTISKTTARDYREIDGYWIPFHVEEVRWSPQTGRRMLLRIIDVTSIDLQNPVPETTFSIQLPEGTSVIDDINKKSFRLGALVGVSLENARDLHSVARRFGRSTTQPTSR